jgi:hypothetical protein
VGKPPGARAAACTACTCSPETQCQKRPRRSKPGATSNRPEENPGRAYLIAPSSRLDRWRARESRSGFPCMRLSERRCAHPLLLSVPRCINPVSTGLLGVSRSTSLVATLDKVSTRAVAGSGLAVGVMAEIVCRLSAVGRRDACLAVYCTVAIADPEGTEAAE